jgi:hypothetical protein
MGCTASWGALKGKGALEVVPLERIVRLFTIEVTLDQPRHLKTGITPSSLSVALKNVKISLLQVVEAHRVKAPTLLRHGGKVVSPTRRLHFTYLQASFLRFLVLISVVEAEQIPGP